MRFKPGDCQFYSLDENIVRYVLYSTPTDYYYKWFDLYDQKMNGKLSWSISAMSLGIIYTDIFREVI